MTSNTIRLAGQPIAFRLMQNVMALWRFRIRQSLHTNRRRNQLGLRIPAPAAEQDAFFFSSVRRVWLFVNDKSLVFPTSKGRREEEAETVRRRRLEVKERKQSQEVATRFGNLRGNTGAVTITDCQKPEIVPTSVT